MLRGHEGGGDEEGGGEKKKKGAEMSRSAASGGRIVLRLPVLRRDDTDSFAGGTWSRTGNPRHGAPDSCQRLPCGLLQESYQLPAVGPLLLAALSSM